MAKILDQSFVEIWLSESIGGNDTLSEVVEISTKKRSYESYSDESGSNKVKQAKVKSSNDDPDSTSPKVRRLEKIVESKIPESKLLQSIET